MQTIIKCGVKTVSGTDATITFSSDANNETTPAAFPSGYTVIIVGVPEWETSWYVSAAPSETAVTFTFGVGGGQYTGEKFYWQAIGYKKT